MTIFVWSHVTTKKSQIHYTSFVHTRSCSTAFKFGTVIIYINVHIEANFKSKKVCISNVIVLLFCHFQNRIQAMAEPAIPSGSWLISGVQPLRDPSGGNRSAWLFLAQLRGSAKPSQALATLSGGVSRRP